nr:hypothetical protein [Natrarchaeobaculum sulfurireducens]
MVDPTVETLPFEYAQPNPGYIQPTDLLGGIMKLEPVKIRLGFIWREELIEGGRIVRVELIDHHHDAECIR